MSKKTGYKKARPIDEMVVALRKHLSLLDDYTQKVYIKGNDDYAGEIAAKLRLLVTKFRSNEPLLLRLMEETGIEPTITLSGPPIKRGPGIPTAGDKISLKQYMELGAIGIRIPSGEFIMLNKTQFIRAWAEQTGANHEDWSMDESLSTILNSNVFIGGVHGALVELKTTVDAVFSVANRFLKDSAR